jgi:hypothetical protein
MTTGWVVAYAMLWVAVVFVGVTLLGLLRRMNVVLAAAERTSRQHGGLGFGPPVGARLPDFEGRALDGGFVDSAALRARGATVYLFVSPGCAPCAAICERLRATGWAEPTPLVVVTSDSAEGRRLGAVTGVTVVLQRDGEVSDAFGVKPTPFVVAVDDDARITVSRVPTDADHLRTIAAGLVSEARQANFVHATSQGGT